MIIKRYLWKELLTTFGAVFFVLLLLMSGHTFVRYMGYAADGRTSVDLVLQLFSVGLIESMGQMLPFAWFITVMLTFGRLYKDNEMTIFSAIGLRSIDVFRLVMGPSLLCAALVALITFYIDPINQEYSYQLTSEAAASGEMIGISAGGFNSIRGSERVFYIEEISDNKAEMYNVFIQGGSGDSLDIFSAPRARQLTDPESGERYLILLDGYRYEQDHESGDLLRYEYKEASVRIDSADVSPASRKRRAYTSEQLWHSDDLSDKAELHWRLALPISVLLFSLLAVLLSHTSPREGRFAKLFVAVFLYIIYSNFLWVGKSWVSSGTVSPMLGLWWAHLIALFVIIVLYIKRYGVYDLWPKRWRRRA